MMMIILSSCDSCLVIQCLSLFPSLTQVACLLQLKAFNAVLMQMFHALLLLLFLLSNR